MEAVPSSKGITSGYGMTEATGGITMTPPGEYVDGSIGKPLPGIECVRAEDGELLIRGAYVSPGYFKPEGEEAEAHDAEGWFHTGDLVSIDGVQLQELDYVDVGELITPPGVVPVVIKSLLFS